MFEYVLNRVIFNKHKQAWIDMGNIGVFDSLDKALRAQELDKVLFDNQYMYYIEHRIKLDYDTGINTI